MNKRYLLRVNVLTIALWLGFAVTSAWAETVRINGFEMYYEIVGEGEPLVLLHGGLATGALMKPRYSDLANNFRMIIPDLRGHGKSPDPTGDVSPQQAARDVFALLDHLALERVKGLGGSYGSAVLLHMAAQQPDRLEAMVLGAVGSQMSGQGRDIMRSSDTSSMPDFLRSAHIQGDDQVDTLIAGFSDLADDPEEFIFDEQFLSTISAKTLIVTGDRDEFNPAWAALQLYEAIPHSYLWMVPNGSHAVLVTDQKLHEFFLGVVTPFLMGQWESNDEEAAGVNR